MAELQKVDDWLSALLANLEPAARSRMMRQLAQELRRTQQQNIRMQRNPDGSSYEPRRITARSKKGRIKRQMFTKLRTTKYLKTAASADSASVQFEGKYSALPVFITTAYVIASAARDRRSVTQSVVC
ncbi:phage virion morphogenesis protein [Escherichia coli]|nr:phage virion morphogenesis protein [Escherichia coli]